MKIIDTIARVLLGLVFLFFGINGLMPTPFIPIPPMSGHGQEFIGAMHATGYLTVVKVLEVLGALLLLSGRGAKLGLMILGPIVVNILLFHACMDSNGLAMALVLTGLLLVLVSDRKLISAMLSN